LPAYKPVKLNPGGAHVWLADLRRPLKTGDSFTLTLRFERAGERQVAVSVVAPTALPLM
jgi:copper(I)-binding protein